ncbi:ABC transporter permease [Fusobacterium simiae]|uniref:ABC transporter permease n=1 Tax=Fusobacterium simiae TaxID=855 RepID=A0ABT4DFD3_FUSSI|nr:ABC transporter permease [Fusobacterium simiae]MCY7007310.1 ABC transporter permease [Fusobacterium simiae]
MSFFDILKGSLATLKANKLRTLLTMLGIIIGISSVIAMWAIGDGGRDNILGDLKKIGYGKFTVTIDYKNEDFKYSNYFTMQTVEMLKASNKFKGVAASIEDRFRIMKDKRSYFSFGTVSTEDYEKISPVTMISGRNFLPFEYESNERIITLDSMSAKKLFGDAKLALGQYLEISKDRKKAGHSYKIVGVFKSPYESFDRLFGEGDNFPVLFRIPYKAYAISFNQDPDVFDTLLVEAKNGNELTESMLEAKNILEFNKNSKNLYVTNALSTDIESFDKILSTLSLFVTLAASISLLVGGIGVMNIMLVTVVERTKEIGIRKALGAKNRDILKQFLFESIILTVLGGLVGILVGILFGLLAGIVMGIRPIFSLTSIIVSLSISVIVGIIFGVSPARRAAKLNPIDALRTE